MKALYLSLVAGVVGAAGPFSLPAQAQPASTGATSAAAASDMADAEVRKVDKDNKKITLKHGVIKNLDMPPMTMVFQLKDEAMLDKLQAGDKVRFKAIDEGGKLVVTEIQPVK